MPHRAAVAFAGRLTINFLTRLPLPLAAVEVVEGYRHVVARVESIELTARCGPMDKVETTGRGDHVAETVEQLSRLHEEHAKQTSRLQRGTNRVTATLGRPTALAALVLALFVWTLGNTIAKLAGWSALEEFPFVGVEFVSTIAALLIALLILSTQRHQDELAERRARLTLALAALSEKKIAKVIELLEVQRRDNPLLPNQRDDEAAEMARPTDPDAGLGRG